MVKMTNFISCICCHNNKEALLTSEKICYDYAMPCTNKLEKISNFIDLKNSITLLLSLSMPEISIHVLNFFKKERLVKIN